MEISDWIKENSESSYGEFTKKIVKTSYPINGIHVPDLRGKAKSLAKEDGLKSLESLSDSTYEEMMLQGFVIAFSKASLFEKEPLILNYLCKCDDWSLTDSFVGCFKTDVKQEQYWQLLMKWQKDSQLCLKQDYLQRFILVFELTYYLNDEHIDEILMICSKMQNESLTVKMANGWLLATASIRYHQKVRKVLAALDRKTLQIYKGKIRDSYRISDEIKKEVHDYGHQS